MAQSAENGQGMTVGLGLFAIAVGAILKFALTVHTAGINLSLIGVILMVVGAAVLVHRVVAVRGRGPISGPIVATVRHWRHCLMPG